MENLLEKAIRDYPIGTVYRSVMSGDVHTVLSTPEYYNKKCDIIAGGNYIYYNDRWAEIISSPVPKQLPIFN